MNEIADWQITPYVPIFNTVVMIVNLKSLISDTPVVHEVLAMVKSRKLPYKSSPLCHLRAEQMFRKENKKNNGGRRRRLRFPYASVFKVLKRPQRTPSESVDSFRCKGFACVFYLSQTSGILRSS